MEIFKNFLEKNFEDFLQKLKDFYSENINLIPNISEMEKKEISSNLISNNLNDLSNQKGNPIFITEEKKSEIIYESFLKNLINYLNKKNEDIEIAIEILLFVSFLTNQNDIMKLILKKNEEFFIVLRKIVNENTKVKYFYSYF